MVQVRDVLLKMSIIGSQCSVDSVIDTIVRVLELSVKSTMLVCLI